MTTTYPSKKVALEMAVYYATGEHKAEPKLISKEKFTSGLSMLSPEMSKGFGETDDTLEVYEVLNSKGEMARFGINRFRDGWNLWIIADNGMMMRT